MYCLLSGYSIRKSAKETGISIQTSFDWRHKLLSSFSSVSVEEFKGIVESDDLFFVVIATEVMALLQKQIPSLIKNLTPQKVNAL